MNNKLVATVMILSLCTCTISFAGTNYSYQKSPTPALNSPYTMQPLQYDTYNTIPYSVEQPLYGNVVMVPAGTSIPVVIPTPISSANAYIGQTVTMALNSDYYYKGKCVTPAGSIISGTVIELVKAKHGSINGRLCIRFTQLTTPGGVQMPISAVIKTDDNTGVLVGGTKVDVTKEYAKDVAAGSAAGALSGLVFGALAGGNVGRGTALGTAVGAGSGLAKSVWDKGNDVEIPANSCIELMLTQPFTASDSNYRYEN